VTNWDWVNQLDDPFGENATSLGTRTWYGIPHSVRVFIVPRGDKLYQQIATNWTYMDAPYISSEQQFGHP